MKYVGVLIVASYAWMTFSGYEPFPAENRGHVDAVSGPRRGTGGLLWWTRGFQGGK